MPLFLLTHNLDRSGDGFVNGQYSALVEATDEADAEVVAEALDPKLHGSYWANATVTQLSDAASDFTGSTFGPAVVEGTITALAGGGFALAKSGANITVSGTKSVNDGRISFAGQPSVNDTVTVGDVTYTFKSGSVSAANEVLIGSALIDTVTNLINAINLGVGEGTLYGAGTTLNDKADANYWVSSTVALETPTGGVLMPPALESPSAGKLPTDLSGGAPVLDGWWRADQMLAIIPGETDTHAWGSILKGPISPWTGQNSLESISVTEPKPIYLGDSDFNNREVIEFASDSSRRIQTNEGDLTLPYHFFIVMKQLSSITNRFILDGATLNSLSVSEQTAGTFVQRNSANTAYVNSVTLPAVGTVFLLESYFSGTTASFQRVNGGAKSTGSSAGVNTVVMTLGNGASGANTPDFRVAEVIRFKGEVTSTDLTNLYAYLKDRYNIIALP